MPPDLDDNFADGEERDACDRCGGDGGYHDCGEDTCPCADPERGSSGGSISSRSHAQVLAALRAAQERQP